MVPITVISLNLHLQRPSLVTLTSETRGDYGGGDIALYFQLLLLHAISRVFLILYAYTNQYRR